MSKKPMTKQSAEKWFKKNLDSFDAIFDNSLALPEECIFQQYTTVEPHALGKMKIDLAFMMIFNLGTPIIVDSSKEVKFRLGGLFEKLDRFPQKKKYNRYNYM